VRGMADACLHTIGVETDAAAVGLHYGARRSPSAAEPAGLLDGWLVDETDAGSLPSLEASGLLAASVPLWMRDLDTSAALAGAAIDLAARIRDAR